MVTCLLAQFVAEPVLKLLGTPRFARHASALFGPIGAEVILTLSSLGVATKGDLVANVVASSGGLACSHINLKC